MKIKVLGLFVAGALVFLSSCGGKLGLGGVKNGYGYLQGLTAPGLDAAGSYASLDTRNPANQGYWDGDGSYGSPSIRINLSQQKAFFYKGSDLVGMSPISSGTATHQTPKGRFKISQKSKDHKSSLYGVIKNTATGEVVNEDADTRKHRAGPGEVFENAPMPYFMRFNGGIGMHTGHLPGYPASHGCIRMPDPLAAKFFENVSVGTPVIVE